MSPGTGSGSLRYEVDTRRNPSLQDVPKDNVPTTSVQSGVEAKSDLHNCKWQLFRILHAANMLFLF